MQSAQSGFRLLKGNRIKQAVRGLQTRLERCSQSIQAVHEIANQKRSEAEREFESQSEAIRSTFSADLRDAYTKADEASNSDWTRFDAKTLRSLDYEKREIAIRRERLVKDREFIARELSETQSNLRSEAKKKKQEAQQTFETRRKQLQECQVVAKNWVSETLQFSAKYNIRIDLKQLEKTTPQSSPANAPLRTKEAPGEKETNSPSEALERIDFRSQLIEIQKINDSSQALLKGLLQSNIAKFADSWLIWILSVCLGLLSSLLVWAVLGEQPPLTRLGIAIVGLVLGCVLSGIGLIIALRRPLRRQIESVFPEIVSSEQKVVTNIEICDRELLAHLQAEHQRIDEKLREELEVEEKQASIRLAKLKQEYDDAKIKIGTEQAFARRDISSDFESQQLSISRQIGMTHKNLLRQKQLKLHAVQQALEKALQDQRRFEENQTSYFRWRIQHGIRRFSVRMEHLRDLLSLLTPAWPKAPESIENILRGANELGLLPIGSLAIPIGADSPELIRELVSEATSTELPIVFRLVEDGVLTIDCDSATYPHAQSIVNNLVLRAFQSLPAGRCQVTLIDPDGLGKDYSHFMQLADLDPNLVNHRVWTQSLHIQEQLAKLSHHTEDIIQQLLRDTYPDIREYNANAGTLFEPYRIVVWSRFPAGLDETSWRYLSSLISSGGRCGISVVLLLDQDFPVPPQVDLARLAHIGLKLRVQANQEDSASTGLARVVCKDETLGRFPISAESPPESQIQSGLLQLVAEDSLRANRVEVPFEAIVPSSAACHQNRSASGLAIPLGQAGVGRNQSLRLGHGTAQHVLVAGKTGSGKSSLLHTLVTSAAIHYAPDQLRLVLLDFKKGVEFQVYAESKIDHADVIGIESQREFGLSALEYLDRLMQNRGEAFREAGVQDLPSWCERRPNQPMPRVLVVIDEFQEIFTEDDKVAQQSAMYLDRIVRQGRSFGIHVVLASQTLGGAYSLPRTTLAQMAVRIALQCEGSDAMLILSEDNLAAERLRNSGQAIYNEMSGRIEGNQPFQVAYLEKEIQKERLSALPQATRSNDPVVGSLAECVIFEGHKKAEWNPGKCRESLASSLATAGSPPRLVLGDSVSIDPLVSIVLHRQSGQNVLVVGNDDENLAAVLRSAISSFAWSTPDWEPTNCVWLDGSRAEDSSSSRLADLLSQDGIKVTRKSVSVVDSTIADLHQTMKERLEILEETENASDPNRTQWPSQFLVISHLGRVRNLRRNEEFSFDDDQPKTDKLFAELLRDGPSVGIHVCVGVENASIANRWLSRQSMHDFEFRILMQMSANDSNHLIDSAAASRLDRNVLLLHCESTGVTQKFRPYAVSVG